MTDTEVKRLQIKPPPRWEAVKTSTGLGPFDFLEVAFIHEHFAPIPTCLGKFVGLFFMKSFCKGIYD